MARAEQVRRPARAAFIAGLLGLVLQGCTCSTSPPPGGDRGADGVGGTRDTASSVDPTGTTGDTAEVPLAWVSIDVGANESCGVLNDGRLVCWGDDETVSEAPVGASFAAVSMGNQGGCGLTSEAGVTCWCHYGGEPRVCDDQPVDAGYVEVQNGTWWACAETEAGNLRCWGDVPPGAPADQVVHWSIDEGVGCAALTDGRVYCWGNTSLWSDAEPPPLLGPPPELKYTQVAVGRTHACALDTDGEVHCWGRTGLQEPYPAAPPGPFASITAWSQVTCGIRPDATADCWYDFPQLNEVDWRPPLGERWARIGLGEWDACGLTLDGEAQCWMVASDSLGEVTELPSLSEL